jgi:replicative DNA helicase
MNDAALAEAYPLNRDAELAVLGSMLADKDALLRALDQLGEDDFYESAHKKVFAAVRALADKGVAPDAITVGEHLQKQNDLEPIGGQACLFNLVGQVPSALNVDHYARIVREKSLLRRMIQISRDLGDLCSRQAGDPHELLDQAQQTFFQLAEAKARRGMIAAAPLMQTALATLESLAENNRLVTGVPTGFLDLDKLTSGLQPANLVIVAGRPSMGKTALCLNMAAHVALREKRPVLFFSLEMSEQEMGLRLLCSEARVNVREIRDGILAKKAWPACSFTASKIAESPLYFDFSTSPTALEVRGAARRWAHELRQKGAPLALVIVDYLQLMRGPGRAENRQQEISEISRSLKGLARELNVPVVALSQLNRRPEDRAREGNRPQLSDLRESGAIEQDADVVLAILREEVYKRDDPALRGKAKLFILKQRNGPIGEVELNFLERYTRFADASQEQEPSW